MDKRMLRGMIVLGFQPVRIRGSHLICRLGPRTFPLPLGATPEERSGLNVVSQLVRLGLERRKVREAFGLRVD